MNLIVKLTKNRSNVDGTSLASSSRQTETNTTVNTENNSIQSYAQNSQYYTENSNDEHEYYGKWSTFLTVCKYSFFN